MKLIPDITSAFVDPFRANKTLVIIFSIVDPFTDEPFSRDPRQVAAKAEAYLRSTGIADTCSNRPRRSQERRKSIEDLLDNAHR